MRDIIDSPLFFILRSLKLTVFCCLFNSLSYPSIPSLELSQECFKILIFTLSHIHSVYNPSPCSNLSLNNLQNYILEAKVGIFLYNLIQPKILSFPPITITSQLIKCWMLHRCLKYLKLKGLIFKM